MGVYIKNMEMPESCYYCPFADGVWQKNKRCLINGKEMPRDGRDVQQNHISCPLTELPPHGRLIDADALSSKLTDLAECEWNQSTGTTWAEAFEEVDGFVQDAPTIIEAEGRET